jgi:hypothetical protein
MQRVLSPCMLTLVPVLRVPPLSLLLLLLQLDVVGKRSPLCLDVLSSAGKDGMHRWALDHDAPWPGPGDTDTEAEGVLEFNGVMSHIWLTLETTFIG